MIADGSGVIPGWFWVDTEGRENIQSVLFRTLITVDNEQAKKIS